MAGKTTLLTMVLSWPDAAVQVCSTALETSPVPAAKAGTAQSIVSAIPVAIMERILLRFIEYLHR